MNTDTVQKDMEYPINKNNSPQCKELFVRCLPDLPSAYRMSGFRAGLASDALRLRPPTARLQIRKQAINTKSGTPLDSALVFRCLPDLNR